jgi:hypothetical protein
MNNTYNELSLESKNKWLHIQLGWAKAEIKHLKGMTVEVANNS